MQGELALSPDGSHVYFVAHGVLTGGEENLEHEQAEAAIRTCMSTPSQKQAYNSSQNYPQKTMNSGETTSGMRP